MASSNLARLLLLFGIVSGLRAEVRLPALLTDHMVIQRGNPVHIWGTASPNETVTVTFRDASRSAVADDVGMWSVYLPPSTAGGPFALIVKGQNEVTLRDVLVGDVWVASGQSNMEFRLKDAVNGDAEAAASAQPKIRLLMVKRGTAHYPLADASTDGWKPCEPQTARDASAVAYFFARHLVEKTGVPIGVIQSYWGGTPVEAWMSLRALASEAAFMPAFALWSQTMEDFAVHELRRTKQVKEWQAAGKPGVPWEPNIENSWMPAGTYNAMIAPLTRTAIRGVVWYQGESNASPERVALYAPMFRSMIEDWRRAWGVGEFPFLFVQLANFKAGVDGRWPELREAQLQTLRVGNTGMASAVDIGDARDIHPKNKQDVGSRLALAARVLAYGESIEYSGPLYRQAVPEGTAMRVWFDHAAGLKSREGALQGFEVAGADRRFVAAEARIEDRTVVVSNPTVVHPRYVRYGWSDDPQCNLYNGEDLPASPFRSGE